MKTFLTMLLLLFTSQSFGKLYSFKNYPEIVQDAISRDIHKPNPTFITEVDVATKEVDATFIAQLKFDEVNYSIKKNGSLSRIKLEYKNIIKSDTNAYGRTYFHMIGMRMNHYMRVSQCSFSNTLKNKEQNGTSELSDLMTANFGVSWLNYATSNLMREKNIGHGLTVLSKYCGIKEKELSSTEKFLRKWKILRYTDIVELSANPNPITIDDLLKYDFFNI